MLLHYEVQILKAFKNLGACYFLRQDVAKSLADCNEALIYGSKEAEAFYNRGNIDE